jgi:hypothetical protein
MTKEEWDLKQNSLKKSFKYIPTGVPGQVKKIEDIQEEEGNDGGKKKKKEKEGKEISTQFGKYSGNVIDGKYVDKPTELQALKTNIEYMKKNMSDQSETPSNVYRPENEHKVINYNKKKLEEKMNKSK